MENKQIKERIEQILPDNSFLKKSICSNCLNAHNCGYLLLAREPILFCEDFCDREPVKPVHQLRIVTEDDAKPEIKREARTEKFRGLCVNCSKRNECKMSRPESGVWFCEEYE